MAIIHVNRSGTSLGTFSEEEVREGLRSGRFLATDLGWREGMAEWGALGSFAEFAEMGAAAAAVPPVGELPAVAPGSLAAAPAMARTGLPWDNREALGFLPAFLETLKQVLAAPSVAFSIMRREGGIFNPLLYALIGGTIGLIVSMLFQLALQSVGFGMGNRNAMNMLAGLGIGSVFLIILAPILVAFGLFLGSALVHLCLMLVGGAKQSFETTFRVMSYTHGSTGILQMIPLCGGLIAGVWALVCNCIGLARAHEIETGRAALAVFLPLILCCVLTIVFVSMAGGMAALQHMNNR